MGDDVGISSFGRETHKRYTSRLERTTKHTGHPLDSIIFIVVAAIGFIVALAWRDLATVIFDKYIKPEDELRAAVMYAIIVTIASILVIYMLSKIG